MRSLRFPAALVLAAASLALVGCEEAEQAARDAASQAASDVADAASSAAADAIAAGRDEVLKQACAPLEDGTVSAEEVRLLSALADGAEQVGLPAEVAGPLQDIAAAGDQAPEEAVQALRDGCADATGGGN